MRSLVQVAEAHSRKLGKKVFYWALPILFVVTLTALSFSKIKLLEQSHESIQEQLAHAVSVGDGFQIQRVLGAEVRSGVLIGASLVLSDSQKTEFRAGSYRHQKQLTISDGLIVISRVFLIEAPNGQIAKATLSSSIPLTYLLIVILLVLFLSLLFSYSLNVALIAFASELTNPIRGLAAAVSDNDRSENSGIYEIAEVFEQIRQAKEMEQANRLLMENTKKSEALISLSRKVAHDIRSPLSAIKVGVNLLGYSPSSEAFELVKSAVKRIDSIAEDLLHTSKRHTEVFDLQEILVDLVESFSLQSGLTISYHGDTEIQICAPRTGLSRAFSNLIQNAIDACADREGSVSITASSIGARAFIEIHDTGKGMPLSVVAQLGRVSGFSFDKADGNGLGFYSAQSVIKSLGGEVRVQSENMIGTKIRVMLPILSLGGKSAFVPTELADNQ